MLDALKARDSTRMRKVMINHVTNKRDVVVQLLKSEANAKADTQASAL